MEKKYTITLSLTAVQIFSLFVSTKIDCIDSALRLSETEKAGDQDEIKVQKTKLEVCKIIEEALNEVNFNEHL